MIAVAARVVACISRMPTRQAVSMRHCRLILSWTWNSPGPNCRELNGCSLNEHVSRRNLNKFLMLLCAKTLPLAHILGIMRSHFVCRGYRFRLFPRCRQELRRERRLGTAPHHTDTNGMSRHAQSVRLRHWETTDRKDNGIVCIVGVRARLMCEIKRQCGGTEDGDQNTHDTAQRVANGRAATAAAAATTTTAKSARTSITCSFCVLATAANEEEDNIPQKQL